MNRLAIARRLVIGSATGIGREVCRVFADGGADVAVADLAAQTGKEALAGELRDRAARPCSIDVDVTDRSQITAAIDTTIARFGHLDILVSNAGTSTPAHPFADDRDEDWQRIVSVNLSASPSPCAMRPATYGRTRLWPDHQHRVATRPQAVARQRHVLRHQGGRRGADRFRRAGSGRPRRHHQRGLSRPDRHADVAPSDPEWNRWKIASLPAKRIGEPREIAWAYVYLASDEATYCVGQSLSPNGGDVMW